MPYLHSLRSWAMHFTFARPRLAGKMIIIPRLRLGQIIFTGALINCLSLNNYQYFTVINSRFYKYLLRCCRNRNPPKMYIWWSMWFSKNYSFLKFFWNLEWFIKSMVTEFLWCFAFSTKSSYFFATRARSLIEILYDF